MISFGNVPLGSVLPIPFASYAGATGASVTLTGLAVTDIEVYKGTSVTQRASDAGYALIDTDGIDIDGLTGIHAFSIDTGDNTDSGFYAAGSFYTVVVSAVTIDSQTVNFIAATFRLVAAENTAGVPVADTVRLAGTAQTARDIGASVLLAANAITAAVLASDAGTEIAAAVWAESSRTLTAIDEDSTTIDLDATIRAAVGLASANLDTQIDTLPTAAEVTTAVWAAGTRSLTILDEDSTTIDLDATIRAAVGLASANLDTQIATLATAAALATVDGIVDALLVVANKLDDTLEDDGGTYRFTANALEEAPSGGGGGTDWDADERTAIRSILGIPASGTTPDDPSTGILDTIRDSVATRASQSSVDDLPTNAELATALGTADDAVLSAIGALPAPLTAAGTRTALGLASADLDTQLDAIKADTAVSREYGDNSVLRGTVGTGSTTTSVVTSAFDPAGAAADQFKGRVVLFDKDTATAALRGQGGIISASSNAAEPVLTMQDPFTHAPSSGDTFQVT